jgi:hypothetical protein
VIDVRRRIDLVLLWIFLAAVCTGVVIFLTINTAEFFSDFFRRR